MGIGLAIGFNGVSVALSPSGIRETYGVVVQGPDLGCLLRHRAVLLSLDGLLLTVSSFRPELRAAAATVCGTSMATFVLFALTSDTNAQQRRVAMQDLGLLAALGLALVVSDGADTEDREPMAERGRTPPTGVPVAMPLDTFLRHSAGWGSAA